MICCSLRAARGVTSTCHLSPVSGSERGFRTAIVRWGGREDERSVGGRVAPGGGGDGAGLEEEGVEVVRNRNEFGIDCNDLADLLGPRRVDVVAWWYGRSLVERSTAGEAFRLSAWRHLEQTKGADEAIAGRHLKEDPYDDDRKVCCSFVFVQLPEENFAP